MKTCEKLLKPEKLTSRLCHAHIFSLSAASTDHILFLGLPGNQQVPKVNTISCNRASIVSTSSPIRVSKRIEAHFRLCRVEQSLAWIVLNILQHSISSLQMNIRWCWHELAPSMHCIGNVRTCDRKIKRTTNECTIRAGIIK